MRPGKRRPLQQLPQRQLPRHRPHRLLLPEFRSDRREIRLHHQAAERARSEADSAAD